MAQTTNNDLMKIILAICFLWISNTAVAAPVSQDDPEYSDQTSLKVSRAKGKAVVVTAHPQASLAALEALRQGGHAVDALVVAQSVLSVVEPQSSGLGGGGFLLHWDAQQRKMTVLDGRETAPLSSRPNDLLTPEGKPMSWREATVQPTAIGIPGTVALLWEAHQRYGRLTWQQNLQAAMKLAGEGFLPTPRLQRSILLAQQLGIEHSDAFKALYLPGGKPPITGQRFRNPALAVTLQRLAQDGAPGFYKGVLAEKIIKQVNALKTKGQNYGGWLAEDLESYAVEVREPLCLKITINLICTTPPPSSGGLALLQTASLLTAADENRDPNKPASWQSLYEALPLADADRLYWLQDPMSGSSPLAGLLNSQYLGKRSLLMGTLEGRSPKPGLPFNQTHYPYGLPKTAKEDGTSHVSIVDSQGNIASYTGSVETVFGSRVLVDGMILNNQLTDFSFQPEIAGISVANRRLSGRRPMSSMAPIIVMQEDRPILVAGSPGGRTIPHYLSRILLASLIWGETPVRTVALPHLSVRNGKLVVEKDPPVPWPFSIDELSGPQWPIRQQRLSSGVALLQRIDGLWHGAADPRREGTAVAIP